MTVPPVPANLPVIMTQAGAQPTPLGTINATILSIATTESPGLYADLPGLLIEDMSSTATAAASLSDQARVEAINSITFYGANEFILNQQGQQAGIMLGQPTNTSVLVTFTVVATSGGAPQQSFVIPPGFAVTDGTNGTYVVRDGGLTNNLGVTQPLFCIAVNPGTWPVPPGTVTTIQTSVPSAYTVTCTNSESGTPGQPTPESWTSYRTRCLTATQASATGMPSLIRTRVSDLSGVVKRSVSIQTPGTGGVLVLAAGADSDSYAYALYRSAADITNLVTSVNQITGFTRANPGVATTALYHGITTSPQSGVVISGSNPTNYNGTYTVTVIDDYNFSVGVDTSGFPAYVGSAICQFNPRNSTVTVTDPPDTYTIPTVIPLTQTVTGSVTWNTNLTSFVLGNAVNQQAAPALVAYVNSLFTGQQMNEFELIAAFQAATAAILPNQYLTRLVFTIEIDGFVISPTSGTGIYPSDTQSYLVAALNAFTVAQG